MDAETARGALLVERERLERDLAQLQGGETGHSRESADRPDDAAETFANELDEGMEDDLRASLDEVAEALDRIDAGTYGRCVGCGEAIPVKRLEALPASARCMDCQRKAEHR
jgi:RNA polymerase-binding transcription factor DksA